MVVKRSFQITPDSIYCFDRGYSDYSLFSRIHNAKAFFVTRAKDAMKYEVSGQHSDVLKNGILSDEIIQLTNNYYKNKLRLVRYYDEESGELFEFLTNNFHLSASTIAKIYQARWQIEAFFKWIKQNLKIKTFLGTNQNAVLTQIWVAMCYYLLLAYIKYQTKFKKSLFYLHKLIQDALFSRLTLIDLLTVSQKRLERFKLNEFQFAFL
jgi:IS4 transposase